MASTDAAIQSARHFRAVAWQADSLGAYPLVTIPRGSGPRTEGYWWHRAVQWRHTAAQHAARTDSLRHGTQSACYAFVDRRFGGDAGLARAIIARESGCHWYAQNPYSTAAGVAQFLDSWGPLSQRLDVVWSVNTMYRASRVSWSPWYPLP